MVLPAFNEENFIRTALDSLNEQSIAHELIVVDNGSSDRTVEIARLYTPLVFTSPRGKLNAKQLGVYEASGDVVAMADADTFYPPDYLAKLTRHFNDPNVVVAVGVAHKMNQDSALLKFADKLRGAFNNMLFKYGGGPVSAYRRNAYLATGGYNLNVDQFDFMSMVWEEEVGLNHRLLGYGRFVYDPSAEAFHYDRRGTCSQCPNAGKEVCAYCREIERRQRF